MVKIVGWRIERDEAGRITSVSNDLPPFGGLGGTSSEEWSLVRDRINKDLDEGAINRDQAAWYDLSEPPYSGPVHSYLSLVWTAVVRRDSWPASKYETLRDELKEAIPRLRA